MRRGISAAIVSIALLAPCQVATGACPVEARLDEVVPSCTISECSFARALIVVASQHDLPMGIEWIEPSPSERIERHWDHSSLREIINSLVNSRPGYSVRFDGGRTHVYYRGAESDTSNFLNLKLESFSIQEKHIAVALYQLRKSVAGRVSPQAKQAEFLEIMLEPNDRLISEQFQNSTVRSILDDLTLQSDSRVWVVTFPQKAGLTRTGYRRTCSLWNSAAVHDDDQPIWDRFRWGMPLPPCKMEGPGVKSTRTQP